MLEFKYVKTETTETVEAVTGEIFDDFYMESR